jgi:hypothetical protein
MLYEADQAIIRSLRLSEDQDRNNSCVIRVLLEDCRIPIELQNLTCCDMTIEQDFGKHVEHAMEHGINIFVL